jgi:ERCC4-type nuclease
MSSVKIIIDNREKALKDHFTINSSPFNITYENLTYGDINIYVNDVLISIIERKTLSDLTASIKDGRYKKQKQNVLANHDKHLLLYLIEGYFDYDEPQQEVLLNGISKKILLSAMINTLIRDNIKMITTKSTEDTIHFLSGVFARINADPDKYTKESSSTSVVQKMDKSIKITKNKCFYNQLCQVPGISAKTAETISKRYTSLYSFVTTLSNKNLQEKQKLLKDIKLDSDKGKSRSISATVINNIIYYFSEDDSPNECHIGSSTDPI